jgi:hypothetical protein
MVTCYPSPGKKKALKMCEFFAAGARGKVAKPGQDHLEPGPAFFYGWTDHTLPLMKQCQSEGRDYFYADNAYYFGRGKYFRITKNKLMHDGSGNAGPERFRQFSIALKPWRSEGRHIVIASQSETFYQQRMGISRDEWTARVVEKLKQHTERPIIVCHKPDAKDMRPDQAHAPGFESHLQGAWAMVTHSSSAAVKAVIDGIPVFCDPECMCALVGETDLSKIETPRTPEGREQWLWNLAANQWAWEEIRNGTAWRALRG